MSPGRVRLQRIVEAIEDDGTVIFSLMSKPQQILTVKDGLNLLSPRLEIPAGSRLVGYGYRYCPGHWEWALMLRPHRDSDWYEGLVEQLREGALVDPPPEAVNVSPVVAIVSEPNRMDKKGGSRTQVSAYLSSAAQDFSWTPSRYHLEAMLKRAHDLYGWAGPKGLGLEIFERV